MSRYGYGYVPEKGFLAFMHDLAEGDWKDVSIKKVDASPPVPLETLLEAPRPVIWKLRLTWGIRSLVEATANVAATVAQLDEAWDSIQRKLHYTLGSASEDKDLARKQAAERLRGAFLLGSGIAQTKLGWQEEVDFGRRQIELGLRGPFIEDVKKLGLAALFTEIDTATEALARGIGRGSAKTRSGTRAVRIREALTACIAAFNGVHDEIAWLIEQSEAGEAREHLLRLFAPFEALLDRYPAPTSRSRDLAPALEPAPPSA